MWWVWRWLPLVVALVATTALPVPDEVVETSTKLIGSSVVTSVSVVMGEEDGPSIKDSEKSDTRKVTEDLPASPADLLKPDGFQFYTVDDKGQLITRQMTDSEIQSIIAAGGGPFPIETQDPQKTGEDATGEMKVADVVQNVQNVLKGELSKPATAIGTVPTIPGHANAEWSSILPAILGGDTESAPVTLPEADKPVQETSKPDVGEAEIPATPEKGSEKLPAPDTPETKPEKVESLSAETVAPTEEQPANDELVKPDENTGKPSQKPEVIPERPMIQVPVITAESVHATSEDPSLAEAKPVYQILNTISADQMTNEADGETEATKNADKPVEESSSGIIPATDKTKDGSKDPVVGDNSMPTTGSKDPVVGDNSMPTTAATVETIVEMEVTSSFVPESQTGSDKQESSSSSSKETEEIKSEIQPAPDAPKVETPSITLEAPTAEEKPADPPKSEEKETQVISDEKPAPEGDKTDETSAAVDEKPNTPNTQQTEATTLAAAVEQEVPQMVDLIPESISTIVDELIAENVSELPEKETVDEVKSKDPEVSINANAEKKPEATLVPDETKLEESEVKTEASTASVPKEPEASDVKETLPVIPASQIPETEVEPVFQMMPEIIPDSSVTKIAAEPQTPADNIQKKPEPVKTQSNVTQDSVPVIMEAATSATEKNEETKTTLATVEKKPETLLTELADSVSSMISQVSEVMPSMVPIPQNSESTDQPIKRVEDGVRDETSTVKIQAVQSMDESASQVADKPLATELEAPPAVEITKPEKTDPELIAVEVKEPETATSSITDASETTKTSDPVSTDVQETSSTVAKDKLESAKIETPSESSGNLTKVKAPMSDEKKTEEVLVTPADSEPAVIPEASSSQEPVKSDEAVGSKPEVSKPEKIETSLKDSEIEAPIVRIDITEAEPTVSGIKNDDSTESSVVRIQLVNPVSTINQMIDAAPEIIAPLQVADISFPEKNVLELSSAQNAASSLIAGEQPKDTMEIKIPEASAQPDPATQIIEAPKPTQSTNIDSDVKTPFKSEADNSNDDKSQPEVENTKVPQVQVPQAMAEDKPEVNDEANTNSPTSETEIPKTTEKSDEKKPEKPVEAEIPKDTPAPVDPVVLPDQESVNPVVKIDLPTPVADKVESPTESEDQKETIQATEKIVEPVPVISGNNVEQTSVTEPVKETVEMPTVGETSAVVPSEVVVSTSVDVRPTEESSETEKPVAIKNDNVEPAMSDEKKNEEANTNVGSESSTSVKKIVENSPENDNTETKINDTPNTSTQDLIPVELATPVASQPQVQPSDNVPDVSTSIPASGDKVPEKMETQQEAVVLETMQTDSKIQNTESTEKKPELLVIKNESPAQVETGSASPAVKEPSESVAKPEAITPEDTKSPSSEKEPEEKISSVTNPEQVLLEESSASNAPEKDQASVPLVRIDVSPEKDQPVSSTKKTEKIPDVADEDGSKKSDKPETPAFTKINSPEADEPGKKTENPKDEDMIKSSSAQSAGLETTMDAPESSAKTPDSSPEADVKDSNIKIPAVTETEVVVKATVSTVDSKVPEVTPSSEITATTSQSNTQIKTQETPAKPVVRIDTTSHTGSNNAPPKTQEIRIQVNDTAVLVTKQQIPQEVENKKKVQPTGTDSKINKIEMPSAKKPASPVVDSQKIDNTAAKQDGDKVKVESMTEQKKKPTDDPYVKLGEKKQEQKPADVDALKTQALGNKKPGKTEINKEGEEKWTLIPQSEPYPAIKQNAKPLAEEPTLINKNENESHEVSVTLEAHQSAVSLAESTRAQDKDIGLFAKLCNELAFSYWVAANKGLSTARSLALSPFGMTSMLAMVFLGARGPTSDQMNDILKLDDVVTFNPHLVFQNVTDSVNLSRGQGIANAAFVRELFADRTKAGRILPFYRERAQQFYDGHVEEVNFAAISDLVRRRTNLLIRRQTGGRIRDFVKGNVMPLRSPLAALSANVFQTDCTGASSEGRDGEMYFAVLPAVRQRKLVPVPATVWRSGVLAGYEPGLDATVISLGGVSNLVSTIFVLPGQQGLAAPGDSLDHLERRLLEGAFTDGAWDRLLGVLIPRTGLEVQIPKFSHRSVVNATAALKRMGLDDLFSKHADLKGVNGIGNDLHLADMLQINLFSTCGDEVITGGRHHVEIYPASPLRGARGDNQVNLEREEREEENEDEEKRTRRSLKVEEYVQRSHELDRRSTSLPSEKQLIPEDREDEERSQRSSHYLKEPLQPGKGRQAERPLVQLSRPFLYFVRDNPTGMILHMGRFNPRLMP